MLTELKERRECLRTYLRQYFEQSLVIPDRCRGYFLVCVLQALERKNYRKQRIGKVDCGIETGVDRRWEGAAQSTSATVSQSFGEGRASLYSSSVAVKKVSRI